ncbi:MAG: type II toxin-antitoxin system VapC family toxin [Boseongicola sp. SB0677_bin_26]|nr:type II toxin-antitoxin system VapC family toxin [Boseongicola sp. SB0665_bin_10]MYG26485.1 type II toxin-antitoxin system VapC family toxin [Boseongicola sp. SB0677_bin_26]
MIILDTNVISEVTKSDSSPPVLAWLDRQAEDALYLTTVTIAEISAGVHKLEAGRRRDDLGRRLTDTVELFSDRLFPFDLGAALLYGEVLDFARRRGRAIGFQDGLIAAIAVHRKAAIATRDASPFEAAGVEVINPWHANAETSAIESR